MNHRERVVAAIRFESPFPAPYHVSFTARMLEKMIEYTGNPRFLETLNNAIAFAFLIKPETETEPGFFRDEFGVVWNKTGADKDIGVVDRYIIREPEDLDSYALPPVDRAFIRGRMDALSRTRGGRYLMPGIGFSLFERAWTLRGMENLLCDMLTEPEFVHALMEKITLRNLEIIDIALEYDIDGFYFGDDWGQQRGLIMGPGHWRTFVKPYLSRLYGRVRQAGKQVAQHSCGDIRPVIDDLHEIGLNLYQTYQPEIYGLAYAKTLQNRIAIWGGISTQQALPTETPEGIRRITAALLRAFPEGGLVAAPTHDIPGDVPPENVLAMLDVLDNQPCGA